MGYTIATALECLGLVFFGDYSYMRRKMSWYFLPPEIQYMILDELTYLDRECVEDTWIMSQFHAWRSEWLNYLLVCRMFTLSLPAAHA